MALIQLIIVAILLGAVWISFGQNVLDPWKQIRVPERLGTLQIIGTLEGAEAMAQITKLHGTSIDLTDAYIVEYVHGNERGTVWIGETESRDAAEELTRRMIDGIERGGSGFNKLQQLTIDGHKVFRVDGPGGDHFFYISRVQRERVVWLAIEAVDVMPILEEAVKHF